MTDTMQKNVGGYDRLVRLVVGPLLVVVGVAGFAEVVSLAVGPLSTAVVAAVLVVAGLVLAVTGAVQKCPANTLLGANTYRGRTTETPEAETAPAEETRPGGSD